jgi:NAD(P)-dependent dehydrogenase (short-subunit alcohol dehydrogenase family)
LADNQQSTIVMKKTALVTGANRGLGWELTRQLNAKGYHVLIAVRDPQKALVATEQLPDKAATEVIELDIEDPVSFPFLFEHIQKTWGKLDVLVNNAGVMLDGDLSQNSATSILPGSLRKTFDVNFFGVVTLTNTLLPLLLKSEAANIVNLSSDMGSLHLQSAHAGMPRTFAYNASKAALNMYTIHLAHALSNTSVRVNSVHPGWAKTDMGGTAAPLEAAEAVTPIIHLIEKGNKAPSGKFLHRGVEVQW